MGCSQGLDQDCVCVHCVKTTEEGRTGGLVMSPPPPPPQTHTCRLYSDWGVGGAQGSAFPPFLLGLEISCKFSPVHRISSDTGSAPSPDPPMHSPYIAQVSAGVRQSGLQSLHLCSEPATAGAARLLGSTVCLVTECGKWRAWAGCGWGCVTVSKVGQGHEPICLPKPMT